MSTDLMRLVYGDMRCGHDVPLAEPCEECDEANRQSDAEPEHGPCTWNCGNPSCDAPEYPPGDDD
jgi:hypothetical protein